MPTSPIRQLRADIREAMARGANICRRLIVSLTSSDGFCQLQGMASEVLDEVELWAHYGFASRPPVGSDALVVRPALMAEDAIAVATIHATHKPDDLETGEVRLYGLTSKGQLVALRASGAIDLLSTTGTVNVGGATDAMIKGTALKSALDAFCTALAALTSAGFESAAIAGIVAAATALQTALGSTLSNKVKVG